MRVRQRANKYARHAQCFHAFDTRRAARAQRARLQALRLCAQDDLISPRCARADTVTTQTRRYARAMRRSRRCLPDIASPRARAHHARSAARNVQQVEWCGGTRAASRSVRSACARHRVRRARVPYDDDAFDAHDRRIATRSDTSMPPSRHQPFMISMIRRHDATPPPPLILSPICQRDDYRQLRYAASPPRRHDVAR